MVRHIDLIILVDIKMVGAAVRLAELVETPFFGRLIIIHSVLVGLTCYVAVDHRVLAKGQTKSIWWRFCRL